MAKKRQKKTGEGRRVSNLGISNKLKECRYATEHKMISYITADERRGSGVEETLSGVEKGRQNDKTRWRLYSIAVRGNEQSKTFAQTRHREA